MGREELRVLRPGDAAPDFRLQALDGSTIALSRIPKPVILSFLRHLA